MVAAVTPCRRPCDSWQTDRQRDAQIKSFKLHLRVGRTDGRRPSLRWSLTLNKHTDRLCITYIHLLHFNIIMKVSKWINTASQPDQIFACFPPLHLYITHIHKFNNETLNTYPTAIWPPNLWIKPKISYNFFTTVILVHSHLTIF